MRAGRGVAWAAGVTAGVAGSVVFSRAMIRRDRRRPDPEAGERFAELPPEDLGPVVSHDGTLLSVRAAGDPGRPVVVFSHGFSLDMTTWHFQWKALADRYRCVLYDQRGHGRSGAAVDADYSLQAMGADLRAVLDVAAPDGPAVVVGHSMGGMALLALAQAHPEEFGERIAGVVLADTAAAEVLRGALGAVAARLHAVLTTPRRAGRIRRYMQSDGAQLPYLMARLSNFGPKASPSLVSYIAAISGQAPLEVWTDGLTAIFSMDLRGAIAHVACPALVVVGDVDRLTPPSSAGALVEALPDARLVVLKGAGHVSMMERHGQFNRLLERFLDEAFARRAPAGRA